jgi:hypothetical protein
MKTLLVFGGTFALLFLTTSAFLGAFGRRDQEPRPAPAAAVETGAQNVSSGSKKVEPTVEVRIADLDRLAMRHDWGRRVRAHLRSVMRARLDTTQACGMSSLPKEEALELIFLVRTSADRYSILYRDALGSGVAPERLQQMRTCLSSAFAEPIAGALPPEFRAAEFEGTAIFNHRRLPLACASRRPSP